MGDRGENRVDPTALDESSVVKRYELFADEGRKFHVGLLL